MTLVRTDRLADIGSVALIAVVSMVALLTFKDYGLGWDDYTHAQFGQMLLDFYTSGFSDRRAFSFVNLYMYGGGFDMAAALLDKILPTDLFQSRRLAGAIVGIVGLIAVWRLGRRLGGSVAGLLTLALLASCPSYYGDMFANPKDVPFAVFMVVLVLGLVRIVEEYPRPSWPTIVLFGIALGLSIGSRVLGGLAALYMILPLAILFARSARAGGVGLAGREAARFVAVLLPGFILAYAVMAIIWPWGVLDPLNPIRAIGYFSRFFEKPWSELYLGQIIEVPDMPRSYLPVFFSIKLPEIFILLGLAGLVGAIIAAFRPALPVPRREALVLVAAAAILPLMIGLITHPALYNGIRHFLFVLPPFAVLGGIAGAYVLKRLAAWSRPAAALAMLALLAGFASPVAAMIELHPYQYTHFNRVIGGVRGADKLFMRDYWGLSFKQAARELRDVLEKRGEKPADRWSIAVCGPHPPASVELGPQFVPTWDPKGADFAMMLGEFYCANLDAPVLVEIRRAGVVYARVYDIRGRAVTELFTLPPITRDKTAP